jgi:hypothetical protein
MKYAVDGHLVVAADGKDLTIRAGMLLQQQIGPSRISADAESSMEADA